MPKKKVVKSRVEKLRNDGTMSESAFWSMIRSMLRSKTRYWKPIAKCKKESRRVYKGVNKRQKYEYQCNICKQWYPEKVIAVDHIIPAGSLKSYSDLPDFVKRLFCEVDGLQTLCKTCHDLKTKKEREK